MKKKVDIKTLEEEFRTECRKYNLRFEYPGYTGKKKFAIVTALTKKQFRKKYGVLFPNSKKYVLLTPEQGEAFRDFDRNDKKHQERELRHGIPYDINDGEFEEHHFDIIYGDVEDMSLQNYMVTRMREQISLLPDNERIRLMKHYIVGKTIRQISEEEGVCFSTVRCSINSAIGKLRQYFLEEQY